MNPVLMVAYNNVQLTERAIDSIAAQQEDLFLLVVNNGSNDGTKKYLNSLQEQNPIGVNVHHSTKNQSPVMWANDMLKKVFTEGMQHALLLANDVVIPPDFYTELLKWPRGIVCASEVRSLPLPDMKPYRAVSENTPMSAMLLRKWCYDAVVARDGFFFDEGYFHYASDCDLALRIASCGIRGIQLNVPYLHHSSSTIKNAFDEEAKDMIDQANLDRGYFVKKWGFPVDALEYGQCAQDINFRGEPACEVVK